MKRRFALLAAVAGVLLAVAITRGPTPAEPPARTTPSVPLAPTPVVSPPAGVVQEIPWQTHADRLTTACGLEVTSDCTPSGCAAVAVVPDLDRFRGWVQLGWDQPGLVAATVLADLGVVSRQALPCDAALAAMATSANTRVDIGDGPDGTWLACVWTATEPEAGATPCEEVATRLGLPWHVSDPNRRW